jgi:hypothetical protein
MKRLQINMDCILDILSGKNLCIENTGFAMYNCNQIITIMWARIQIKWY